MNWDQFKDPISHICLAAWVVTNWSLPQVVAGSNTLWLMSLKYMKTLRKPFRYFSKLGQGNIFTSMCQEFCPQRGEVSASVHAGILPQEQTPPRADPREQTPWEQTPPRSRHPREQTHPPGADTPISRHPPGADTPLEQTPPGADPPWSRHPPRKQTATYGQRAAGTHPTGMHSCWLVYLFKTPNWTNLRETLHIFGNFTLNELNP